MSRRERRSVSLGRHRNRSDRPEPHQSIEEDSTRQNVSNYILTLQRVQAAEEENRVLRRENHVLRQRTRSTRLSGVGSRDSYSQPNNNNEDVIKSSSFEDDVIEAETKRNSLIFVGDSPPITLTSPKRTQLEDDYTRLQSDFSSLKDLLLYLFEHAVSQGRDDDVWQRQGTNKHDTEVEHDLADIYSHLSTMDKGKDKQTPKKKPAISMTHIQQALESVLSQTSVKGEVTQTIAREKDKVKDLSSHVTFLETQRMDTMTALRQAEDKLCQSADVSHRLSQVLASNSKHFKGSSKEDLNVLSDRLSRLVKSPTFCRCSVTPIKKFLVHVNSATKKGFTFVGSKPSVEMVDVMTKLERLVASDWHRLGRLLGLTSDHLEDIGKFTNFDLTSRVEKVLFCWIKVTKGAGMEGLTSALEKMDRNINLLCEPPLCKDCVQLTPDLMTFAVAHMIDVTSITDFLAGQGVLCQRSRTFILEAPHEQRRASRLLHTAVFMGSRALVLLCLGLERHSQNIVASKIRSALPSYSQNESNGLSSSVSTPQKQTLYSTLINRGSHSTESTPLATSTLTRCIPTRNAASDSKTKSSSSSKSTDKQQRKKRSRSLFTRKQKNRDPETDSEFGFVPPGEFYYPAINMNYHQRQSSSASGESSGRSEDTPTLGGRGRDTPTPGGRTGDTLTSSRQSRPFCQGSYPLSNCIDGVVV